MTNGLQTNSSLTPSPLRTPNSASPAVIRSRKADAPAVTAAVRCTGRAAEELAGAARAHRIGEPAATPLVATPAVLLGA